MPGVYNLSIDETTKEVAAAYDLGVRSIILFGLPESKDPQASGAYAENGIVQQAVPTLISGAGGLYLLRFGRNQEPEADTPGLRYLVRNM